MKKILLVTLMLLGMMTPAHAQIKPEDREKMMEERKVIAQQQCDRLFNAYKTRSFDNITDLVSEKFLPSRESFIESVKASSESGSVIDMKCVVVSAMPLPKQTIARITWEKEFTAPGGVREKIDGRAMLFFAAEGEKWELTRVAGQDPFRSF